jgi:hypothetical protein
MNVPATAKLLGFLSACIMFFFCCLSSVANQVSFQVENVSKSQLTEIIFYSIADVLF